jgi:hypothetical protein
MSRQNPELAHFYRQLDHLVNLASTHGWKEYAWARAKELDGHPTGMWAGIAQALATQMQAINETRSKG